MPIADFGTLRAKTAAAWQQLSQTKYSMPGMVPGQLCSFWTDGPFAGSAPSTAEAPTSGTAGALGTLFDSVGIQRLAQTVISSAITPTAGGGTAILIDRLSHQGGLSGTTTSAQTTNLPTQALIRNTDGLGVCAALEIYTAVGNTATAATVSYTNQSGAARSSLPVAFGGAGNMEARRFIPLTLDAGDSGVRAVTDVTLAASTGTVGHFGITLFKPLMIYPLFDSPQSDRVFDGLVEMFGQLPQISMAACLSWIFVPTTSTTGILNAQLRLVEE
jgi:hypothetical protein